VAGCDRENLACVCGVEPHSDLPEQEDEKRGKEICGCGVSFSKSTRTEPEWIQYLRSSHSVAMEVSHFTPLISPD